MKDPNPFIFRPVDDTLNRLKKIQTDLEKSLTKQIESNNDYLTKEIRLLIQEVKQLRLENQMLKNENAQLYNRLANSGHTQIS